MIAQVCIAGMGAVGSTFAAALAATGQPVNLLARGTRLEQLRHDGLRVEFHDRTIHLPAAPTAQVHLSARPDFGAQDLLFVAVKAHALPGFLPTLSPLIGPHTLVLPLVNGIPWWYFLGTGDAFDGDGVESVDPHNVLRDMLSPARIAGCVLYLTARLMPDGTVAVMGDPAVVLGAIAPAAGAPAAAPLHAAAALLSHAGIAARLSDRIRNALWTKIALNLATNPLSVVTETTLAQQFADDKLLSAIEAVMDETRRVAVAYACRPSMSLEEMLATGRRAGAFETSMLQDYRAGRPLELDAIGQAVLELAEKVSLRMPATQLMLALCGHRAAQRDAGPR